MTVHRRGYSVSVPTQTGAPLCNQQKHEPRIVQGAAMPVLADFNTIIHEDPQGVSVHSDDSLLSAPGSIPGDASVKAAARLAPWARLSCSPYSTYRFLSTSSSTARGRLVPWTPTRPVRAGTHRCFA